MRDSFGCEADAMRDRKLLSLGPGGSLIAVLCCFTAILVWTLGALGLAAWAAALDYVLPPALLLFVGLTVHALLRKSRTAAADARFR